MNIALVGPVYPYRGGIAHHTMMLAHALAPRHNLLTVSFKRQYPGWLYPGRTDKDPSRQPLRVEAEYLLDPFNPYSWWTTAERIGLFRPQIVVIQWWTTFWALGFGLLAHLLRAKGVPVLYLVHNVLPHELRKLDRGLALFALRRGNAFIAQSEQEGARLETFVPGARVAICPHPLYDMFVGQPVPKAEARRRLGLAGQRPVVLFFGFVRPYKGLQYLIDAIARLRHSGQEMWLVIAGEFWEDRAVYGRQIAELGLQDCVIISDRYVPNEEIGIYFSAADVVAAPYVTGTQSGAVQIALAFALPVVMTSIIAGGAFMAKWGGRVEVVAPRDVPALADAISRSVLSGARQDCNEKCEPLHADWKCLTANIESCAAQFSE
jgi:glycosyltransferase involved in cell wall biosynthesis